MALRDRWSWRRRGRAIEVNTVMEIRSDSGARGARMDSMARDDGLN
jgi:hypothetical protein